MKSIPLIALLVSALGTAVAITAYLLVGRTEPDESFRAQLRRPAAVMAEAVESTSPRAESSTIRQPAGSAQPIRSAHAASRTGPEAIRRGQQVVTPFVEDPPETFTSNSSVSSETPVPTPSGEELAIHRGMTNHHFGRSSNSSTSPNLPGSKFPFSKETAQPLRKDLPVPPSREPFNVGDTPGRTGDVSASKPTGPEAGVHANRASPSVMERPPSPRPFTVEEERLRAQIGWQAFADAIFESSLSPQENTPLQ